MGHSVLDMAAAQGYCGTIRALLTRGTNVNAAAPSGRTALHCAAFRDQPGAVDTLIANGAYIEAADKEGSTALHVASAIGASKAIISLLQRGAVKDKLNNAGRSPLLLAVENGRLAAATLLLHASEEEEEEGFVDRRYGSDEYSALDLAARGGHKEISQMVIRHGADVNSRDSDGVGALYLAALNDQAVIVNILVKAGADVGAQAPGRQNRTALHIACAEGSSRAVKALLKNGASQFECDLGHRTPLHLAARNGDVETVETLLAWGSDPAFGSKPYEYGFTALDEASNCGNVGALRAMCKFVPIVTARSDVIHRIERREFIHSISSAVSIAAKRNQVGAIDALVEAGGNVNMKRWCGGTPIHYAAEGGAVGAIKALARHGANLDSLEGTWPDMLFHHRFYGNRRTALHRTALHTLALLGWVKAAEALLVAGADPSIRCSYGHQQCRPLDIASGEGHVEMMRLMLRYGVNVDGADPNKGTTALHVAAASDQVEAIELLAEAGCTLGIPDNNGCTPLHACVEKRSWAAISALASAGADVNVVNTQGNTPLHLASSKPDRLMAVKALLRVVLRADTDRRNNEGASALDLAAKAGNVAVAANLVLAGARVNAKDADGRTALMHAVKANKPGVVDALLCVGADVEAHLNDETWTSLHAAAEDSNTEVVRVLLKHGADVRAKDAENDNDTPLHVAVRQAGVLGAVEIVRALLRHDADEGARNDNELTPLDVVGSVGGADAARAMTMLLLRAPGDRAWRRRGLLVLCCARAKRMTVAAAAAAAATMISEEQEQKRPRCVIQLEADAARSNAGDKREGKERATQGLAATAVGTKDDFDEVASWLLDLQEEGLFRIVVSYL